MQKTDSQIFRMNVADILIMEMNLFYIRNQLISKVISVNTFLF